MDGVGRYGRACIWREEGVCYGLDSWTWLDARYKIRDVMLMQLCRSLLPMMIYIGSGKDASSSWKLCIMHDFV